ncbi:ribonuclease P protein component [Robiginitalea sp. SC105]|uniref:ribonuclease P protein component n=1 Tax=Robiginitalea sp. SC105 TaxID=2762332 RepID=UPI0016396049|nr:ribonuclease P protein component [Robiginitalea sp. SC105]MBC2838185.1 ribonuclease P protein component [Robiginitalea sp. SC105]
MASFRFPKREKLSRQKLWEEVFSKGATIKAYPLLLYYLQSPLPEPVPVQAGFAVSKRNFRRAVHRNRIKRLMREAFRLEKPGFFNNTEGSFAFVFLYIGRELPDFDTISRATHTLLTKFNPHEAAAED